jgi:hypothetical protein
MTLRTSSRPDLLAFRSGIADTWAGGHHDGPPEDWDEIRARLRALHQSGRARRRHAIGVVRSLDPRPACDDEGDGTATDPRLLRVTWRPADMLIPAGMISFLAWLYTVLAPAAARRWWHQHNPLLVQRLLVVVSVLLLVNLLAGAF